jgi:hypothetical protein
MNLFQFLAAIFGNRAGSEQLDSVRRHGEEDGEASASAYADGFESAADRVFRERLKKHAAIETTAEPIESTPFKSKRFTLANPVNGNGKKHAKGAK